MLAGLGGGGHLVRARPHQDPDRADVGARQHLVDVGVALARAEEAPAVLHPAFVEVAGRDEVRAVAVRQEGKVVG